MNAYYEVEKLAQRLEKAKPEQIHNAHRIIAWVEEWIFASKPMCDVSEKVEEIVKSDLFDDGKDLKPMMKEEKIKVDNYALGLAEDLFEIEQIGSIIQSICEDEII